MCQQLQLRQVPTTASSSTSDRQGIIPPKGSLKLKKCVSFAGSVQEVVLEPLLVHPSCLYYSAQELRAQKEADIETLRQTVLCDSDHDENDHDDPNFCARGLEEYQDNTSDEDDDDDIHHKHAYSHFKLERREHTRQFVRGVLEVHHEQRELGLRDDEFELYMVSRTSSRQDRKQARKRAQQDAQVVLDQFQQEQEQQAAAEQETHVTTPRQRRRSSGTLRMLKKLTGINVVSKALTTSSRNLKKVGDSSNGKSFAMLKRNKTY